MTPTPTAVTSATPLPTFTPVTVTPVPSQSSTITASPPPATPTSTPASPTVVASNTPALGSPTATIPAATGTATASAVTVQSVIPNTAVANSTVILTITGSGFQNGAVVTFEGGTGGTQEVGTVQVVSPTTIMVTVTARNDGSQGIQVWDVRVTNPDTSTGVLTDAFTVAPAP